MRTLQRRVKTWRAGMILTFDEGWLREEVLADPAEGPDSELMSHALDEALEKALQLLPPEMRACVVLVDVEGMEYSDAAEALGIPIGTVRSRLSRARFQLHAILFNYAQSRRWL